MPASAVTGTVTYLERSALPPTAVIEVQLQDVSKMDAPAEVISTQTIEAQGKQVPFPYELKYDPAKIDPAHRYAVRATIKDGGKLLFTSTTSQSGDHQRRADQQRRDHRRAGVSRVAQLRKA